MDLTKQIYSECFNPSKIKVYDGIKKTFEERFVPCGKCYHCTITRVNEWVTRMQLQSMYSKHTYFCTLTYSSSAPKEILDECDAVIHDYNVDRKKQMSPLVLNKTHLQKFFKRLRKNTNKTFQYFACGEYGTKWARPHYHFILWSDDVFTHNDIQKAWSLYDVSFGNIDFQDMNTEAIDITHSFKYVCKYLQKREFDFKNLITYKLHEKNCRINYEGVHPDFKVFNEYKIIQADDKKNISYDEFYKEFRRKSFDIYKKMYSPFFLCSKKPAIGYRYFDDNKERFKIQDYRIFELQGANIFPNYFIRKTKEYVCPYKTFSLETDKPTSYTHLPDLVSLLVELQNCIEFNEGFCCYNATYEYLTNFKEQRYDIRLQSPRYGRDDLIIPQKYFCFYDCKNKYTYSLAPDFMYNVCDSKKNVIQRVPIDVVINEIKNTYDVLLKDYLLPMFYNAEQKRKEKLDAIKSQYQSYEEYKKEKELCLRNLMNNINENQTRYKLRKDKF